ncbi:MAG: beta-ketoacyl-ACP synthase II [Anaerolineales bacterium]|nr:beta-ketoacyl-ACP synthase II [Anaerolineales bacterium]
MTRRVVITGMGTVNPCGLNVAETWDNIVNGRSGIGPITLFDPANFQVKVAGEVKNFDAAQAVGVKEVRRTDRYQHLGMAAAKQAMADSGLTITEANAGRVAVLVSSAIGGLRAIEDAVRTLDAQGPRRVNVFSIPMLMPNGAGGLIAIATGAQGPNFSIASACASGSDSLGTAWQLIRGGVVDAALAGASESTTVDVGVAAFDRLGAMSHRLSGNPSPFDRDRDGIVMGEGAAVLVLEALDHAQARGATILAELAGYAATGDAYHITAPAETGGAGPAAMRRALESACVNVADLGYINAHGTATPLNDASETVAIKKALGESAYQIPVSSTKSMTGHMMGATGALEAILCIQAIRTGVLPPTINYQTPDPQCDLDYIPNTAREKAVAVTMSNAFGFGGHNSVLVLRRFID